MSAQSYLRDKRLIHFVHDIQTQRSVSTDYDLGADAHFMFAADIKMSAEEVESLIKSFYL